MDFSYKTKNTCATIINFEIDNGILKKVKYENGCSGNLTAISRLVEGMQVDDVIERLQGVQCGVKGISCADQLAKALKQQIN